MTDRAWSWKRFIAGLAIATALLVTVSIALIEIGRMR